MGSWLDCLKPLPEASGNVLVGATRKTEYTPPGAPEFLSWQVEGREVFRIESTGKVFINGREVLDDAELADELRRALVTSRMLAKDI